MLSAGGRAPSSYWCTARSARACARAQPPGRAPRYRERRAIARRESRRQSFELQGAEHSLGAWTSARASVATLPPRQLSPSAPPRTARRRRPREQGPLFSPRCRFGFACRGVQRTDEASHNSGDQVITALFLGGGCASPRSATRAAWPASLPARLAACAASRPPRASRRRARRCAATRAAARSNRRRRRGRPSRGRPRTAHSTRRCRVRVRARAS